MNAAATPATLLSCPFCGAAPNIKAVNVFEDGSEITYTIACRNPMCPVTSPAAFGCTAAKAAARWNTRNGGAA